MWSSSSVLPHKLMEEKDLITWVFTGTLAFSLPDWSVGTGNKGECHCLASAELPSFPFQAF